MAQAIRRVVRRYDVAARIGGDEFVVLLPEADRTGAEAVGARILGEVGRMSAGFVRAEVSVGVALWPEDGTDAERLLAVADARMYENKCGRGEGGGGA